MAIDLKNLEARLLQGPGDLSALSPEEQFALIKEKAAPGQSIVTESGLLDRLKEAKKQGKPLRVKFGIDPTGPEIHIGHAVPLINMRRLHRMGHEMHIIIGDFTAMVGDPGDRLDSRPPLTREMVQENMASYAAQASRILDLKLPRVRLHYNSSWLNDLGLSKWLAITKGVTVSSLLQRDDFRKRLDGGHALSLSEFEYALLMGYDSVELKPDIEVGGLDQFLNFHFCRAMMEQAGQKPESILCFDILPGTSGERDEQGRLRKMSKSRGNYIPVEAAPADMYGKTMSVPDEVMWVWFRELTEIREVELKELKAEVESGRLHPKDAKQMLARLVVATFHPGEPGAVESAEKDFNSKFGKGKAEAPPDEQVLTAGDGSLADAFKAHAGLSGSELTRLAKQKGISCLGDGAYVAIEEGDLKKKAAEFRGRHFKVGRLKFFRID